MVATDWDTLTLTLAPISTLTGQGNIMEYEETKKTFKKYDDIWESLKL